MPSTLRSPPLLGYDERLHAIFSPDPPGTSRPQTGSGTIRPRTRSPAQVSPDRSPRSLSQGRPVSSRYRPRRFATSNQPLLWTRPWSSVLRPSDYHPWLRRSKSLPTSCRQSWRRLRQLHYLSPWDWSRVRTAAISGCLWNSKFHRQCARLHPQDGSSSCRP